MSIRKVVFDLDDTLWPLNKRACKLANVDFDKIRNFALSENPLVTEDERERLSKVYNSVELWKEIHWFEGARDLKQLEQYNAKVYINSNCLNQDVIDLKRNFLSKELNIPDDQIILNLIKSAKDKPLDDDMFIFVDDSPFNIIKSTATYNIVPNKPWNQNIDKYVIRINSLPEIIHFCKQVLKETSI